MSKFIWTDEYKLGIGIIDEQHQHFFEIANQIYDTLETKQGEKEKLVLIINELKDYAFYHLATEEKYFNQFAYSDMANHMKYHTMFRVRVGEYIDRIKEADVDIAKLAEDVTDFATNWLSNHILSADKMYAPFFKEKGL